MGLLKSKLAAAKPTLVRLEVPGQKFWTIDIDGVTTTTTYGKIGAKPATVEKKHSDAATATAYYDKQIAEKKEKGYVEPGSGSEAPAGSPSKSTKKAASSPSPSPSKRQKTSAK
jgi:predicted DNA-binding WGR domain protein